MWQKSRRKSLAAQTSCEVLQTSDVIAREWPLRTKCSLLSSKVYWTKTEVHSQISIETSPKVLSKTIQSIAKWPAPFQLVLPVHRFSKARESSRKNHDNKSKNDRRNFLRTFAEIPNSYCRVHRAGYEHSHRLNVTQCQNNVWMSREHMSTFTTNRTEVHTMSSATKSSKSRVINAHLLYPKRVHPKAWTNT